MTKKKKMSPAEALAALKDRVPQGGMGAELAAAAVDALIAGDGNAALDVLTKLDDRDAKAPSESGSELALSVRERAVCAEMGADPKAYARNKASHERAKAKGRMVRR